MYDLLKSGSFVKPLCSCSYIKWKDGTGCTQPIWSYKIVRSVKFRGEKSQRLKPKRIIGFTRKIQRQFFSLMCVAECGFIISTLD